MSENFVLSCCSTVDLTPELLEQRGVRYAHFHYSLDHKEYDDDMGKTVSMDDFYQAMVDGADAHTAQINVEEYCRYFTPFLEAGQDVLHLTLSSGISGSYNSARIAAGILKEQFPERRVLVVDSLGASASYGMLAVMAADLRDEGKTARECAAWLEQNRRRANAYYTTGDLKWLYYGGRVSRTGMTIARALNIWPVMTLAPDGHLTAKEKIRGKKQTFDRIAELVKERVEEAGRQTIYVCHADNPGEAEEFAARLQRECGFAAVSCSYIGSTIGTHTGPGLITVFFLGKERE